jgi:membrane-associated phospholipid phosphatase
MGPRVDADPQTTSGAGPVEAEGRLAAVARRWELWCSAGLTALFIVLTVLVATGAADPFDTLVARHFRPVREWGELQEQYGPWITRLAPGRMFAVLGATCLVFAAGRRSWRTLAFGVVPAVVSVGVALAVKAVLARPDPLGGASPDGGSYPSGHMMAVVVSVAACLCVVSPRVRWWWLAVLAVPCGLMATSLVVTTQHWVSDVVGGALLAGAVVMGSSALLLRRGGGDRRAAVRRRDR